jgi:hypothetical protein
MTEPSWNIQEGKLPDDDGHWLIVSAKFRTDEDNAARMSIEHHYGHRPTQMDIQYLKDEILETMAETGIYSEATDD